LLELTHDILEHLKDGGTLVVPSRQRATAVRVAYSAAMLAAGRRVWNSPDVLPWSAWIERSLDDARTRGERVPQRLSPMEDWLLWQEAVHEACAGFQVLTPDAMIEPVRRAVGLMDDYGFTLNAAATPESAVLKQSREHFRRRCEQLRVQSSVSWMDCAEYLRPSGRLLLAGFSAIGHVRRRWLEQHQAHIADGVYEPGSMQVLDFDNPTQEAEAAAQWCAAVLATDARARLLIIVPQLAEQRHLWERAFSHRLDHGLVFTGQYSSAESTYAIEGGRPLTSYRLVSTALQLISIATGEAQFDELSAVLRSPYLSALDRDESLRADRWLRERNVDAARLSALRALLPALSRELNESAGAAVRTLIESLEPVARAGSAAPAQWAQLWVALLQRCGWPGSGTLGSDEQQERMRFDELLGDFAAVAVPARRLTLSDAYHRLHGMAQRAAFEPATDDVPVTISASLVDPVVRYDGLWVAGLSAEVWPPAAQPDPLLPLPLQYRAALPTASAEGQLQLALLLQQQWRRRARQGVLSWSRSAQHLPRDRSPLLSEILPHDNAPVGARTADAYSPEHWQVNHAPALEPWTDNTAGSVAPGTTLSGGTRLLELQSQCPFRAAAELRLLARPLPQPSPGIDARVRGMILHKAVELFWRGMRDQATLRASSAGARQASISSSVTQAIQQILEREPGDFSPALLRREQSRGERLIGLLTDWELTRSAFSTQILESPLRHELAGSTLELRLDRVDQLEDARLLIIDYKTGKPKPFDGLSERLPQPQLPAYAVAMGPRCAAVVTLYLGREGAKVRGVADRSDRIATLRAPKSGELGWPQLMQRWQRQLNQLIDEHLRGVAAVRPQPDACRYCHLQILCRIDPEAIPTLDEDADDADSETEEESA
jgi:ATP-dependent helicase/nuclease subunit B